MNYDYSHQKRLSIGTQAMPDWSNYITSAKNQVMVKHLQFLQQGEQVLLWGVPGAGCTHLLQAMCLEAQNQPCQYYHLASNKPLQAQMLEGLDHAHLVCIDNIDTMVDDRIQQIHLFDVVNLCSRQGISLILTTKLPPTSLNDDWLIDLKTRLQAMVRYQIDPLDDEHKKKAIRSWFNVQGIKLEDNLIDYVLNHCSRELSEIKILLAKFLNYCEAKGVAFSINNIKAFLKTY